MTPDDALLAECLAHLDDDAPRLVWSDVAGGERGELVAVQCTLARGGLSPAASGALRRRERELIDQHGAAWSALGDLVKRCHFRRGFVEQATMSATAFLEHGEALFDAAPFLNSIVVEDTAPDHVPAVVAHPCFARLRGFGISGISGHFEVADPTLAAAAGAFAELETLYVHRVGPKLNEVLELGDLARLAFGIHIGREAEAVPALLATATEVVALDLSYVDVTPGLVPALPLGLTELAIRAPALPQLAESPHAARIERLMLTHVTRATLPELAAFPNLRALALSMGAYRERTTLEAGFAATPLPSLREFQCNAAITLDAIRAIAETFGAQLEYLFLPGTTPSAELDAIRPLVAGELFASPFLAPHGRPLFAGELPHEPTWSRFVRFPRA